MNLQKICHLSLGAVDKQERGMKVIRSNTDEDADIQAIVTLCRHGVLRARPLHGRSDWKRLIWTCWHLFLGFPFFCLLFANKEEKFYGFWKQELQKEGWTDRQTDRHTISFQIEIATAKIPLELQKKPKKQSNWSDARWQLSDQICSQVRPILKGGGESKQCPL